LEKTSEGFYRLGSGFCQQPVNIHTRMTHTNFCIYRAVPPDDEAVSLLETCRGSLLKQIESK